MSVETVRAFFAAHVPEIAVIKSEQSSATVALAALTGAQWVDVCERAPASQLAAS
jgi:hypothetical protein